jgi:hypothetical protein
MLVELTEKHTAQKERLNNLTSPIDDYSQTESQHIYMWEKLTPGNPEGRSHLADAQRERVQALHDMQLQDVQTDRIGFEQALQKLDRRQFSNEEMRTNRDITTYGTLLNTWSRHIDTLASIQQARREYVSSSLALERGQSIGSSTNEGEGDLNRGAQEPGIEALRQRFTSLTNDIRAYYRRELERPGPVRERVRTLRDMQLQDIQAERTRFERALPNLDGRQERLATLDTLHRQEREYLSASLVLEGGERSI